MKQQSLAIIMLAPFGIRPKGTLSARMLPLAQALVRRGHRVRIVAPPVQNPQDAGTSVEYEGVPVIHTLLPSLQGPVGVAQQVRALLHFVLEKEVDIVHLFKPKGYSGLAALAANWLRPRVPLVVDTDDWEGWGGWNDLLSYPASAKTLFAWQERDLPCRAAAVTVASRTLETQIWGFGVAPDRVFYVPNGITSAQPVARIKPAPDAPPTLLLYTRFWEFDVRELVATLVGVLAARPDARLLVVGRGERGEEQELLRLSERAGIATSIDYRGWIEPAELPALLGSATIALAPMDDTLINRARGLAKLLELMSMGFPIVAARVGQATEYIEHGRSGLLVAPGEPGLFAQTTLHLLENPDLQEQIGSGARERVLAHYTWETLACRTEQAYDRALQSQLH